MLSVHFGSYSLEIWGSHYLSSRAKIKTPWHQKDHLRNLHDASGWDQFFGDVLFWLSITVITKWDGHYWLLNLDLLLTVCITLQLIQSEMCNTKSNKYIVWRGKKPNGKSLLIGYFSQFILIHVAVFQIGNDAVWLLPVMHVRVPVGSYTWKGLCRIWSRKHKVWHNLKIINWLFSQQCASSYWT